MKFEEYSKLFLSIENTVNTGGVKKFASEYPKKIDGKLYSEEEIKRREKEDIFFYIDVKNLNSMINYQEKYSLIKDNETDCECCVCYEQLKKKDTVYMECNHDVCIECSGLIKNNKCPMCRRDIWELYSNDKFCIVTLGEKTERYTFDNGGYHSVKVLLLPELDSKQSKVFRNIEFNEDNPTKQSFLDLLNLANDNGYTMIIQNRQEFMKWADYMYIDWFFKYVDAVKGKKID